MIIQYFFWSPTRYSDNVIIVIICLKGKLFSDTLNAPQFPSPIISVNEPGPSKLMLKQTYKYKTAFMFNFIAYKILLNIIVVRTIHQECYYAFSESYK